MRFGSSLPHISLLSHSLYLFSLFSIIFFILCLSHFLLFLSSIILFLLSLIFLLNFFIFLLFFSSLSVSPLSLSHFLFLIFSFILFHFSFLCFSHFLSSFISSFISPVVSSFSFLSFHSPFILLSFLFLLSLSFHFLSSFFPLSLSRGGRAEPQGSCSPSPRGPSAGQRRASPENSGKKVPATGENGRRKERRLRLRKEKEKIRIRKERRKREPKWRRRRRKGDIRKKKKKTHGAGLKKAAFSFIQHFFSRFLEERTCAERKKVKSEETSHFSYAANARLSPLSPRPRDWTQVQSFLRRLCWTLSTQ